MAIIRQTFQPYIAPQPAQLMPTRQQQVQQPQQQPNAFNQMFQPQPTSITPQQDNQQSTSDRLQQQFAAGTENARALPQLTPVANNPIAATQTNSVANFLNTTSVRPTFDNFYNQLQSNLQIGQNATAAEEAAAQFRIQQLFNSLGNSGGNGGSVNVGPVQGPGSVSAKANESMGQQLAAQRGWSGAEWNALDKLGMMESGWRNTAQNPTSTAFGIGQFLNSTWAGTGFTKTSDPRQQILAMLKYISSRYGDPINALRHEMQQHWY